jgi:hypothetical protein
MARRSKQPGLQEPYNEADRELLGCSGDEHPSALYSPKDIQSVLEAPLAPAVQQKLDQARIRSALALLARGNVHRVQAWLDRVSLDDPKGAVELWLKLVKFTVPELRAVAIDLTTNPGAGHDARQMTINELQDYVDAKMAEEGIIPGEKA